MALDKFLLIGIPIIILINYFLIKNHNLLFFRKTKDKDFYKPQAFHTKSIPRMGGFLISFFGIDCLSVMLNYIFIEYIN